MAQLTHGPAAGRRLLVVVAHPDDEAFGCGSLLAHAAARGAQTFVCCATSGEVGEPAPGSGIEPEALGAVRAAELRAAAAILGVARVDLLGWRDSGTDGDPDPAALVAAPLAEVACRIADRIIDVRPDVVVTLDASDGHRDHRHVRDATLLAVDQVRTPPTATYLWCLPRSLMHAFTGDPSLGTPDEDITTVIDVRPHVDRRWAAMRAHASQVPPYDAMAPSLRAGFLEQDRLVRVRPAWTGGPVEDELLGLQGPAGRARGAGLPDEWAWIAQPGLGRLAAVR